MGWLDKLFGRDQPQVAEVDPFLEGQEGAEEDSAARRRDLIKRVRRLEIVTRRIVNDQLAGNYHAVFKGRGMDFDEVRLYQPGDEIRFIDWNVSAKMEEIYVKRFVEERELTLFLLVDASASQLFGTRGRSKLEVAAEIAAMIAFSAIKNNDRIGLIIFTDEVELFVPPKKGRKHVLRVISQILDFKARSRGTDISAALDFLSRVSKRTCVAFLVSDFLDGDYERSMRITARRHDLIPVVLTDPMEEELPNLGTAWVRDPESGQVLQVDTASASFRRRYKERAQAAQALRDRLLRKMKLDTIQVQTDQSTLQPLVNYFRLRARR
jgi:uncharacterized protein (DUF58 family)